MQNAEKFITMVASVTKPRFDVNDAECFRCGGKGHLAKDCATKAIPKK